MALYRVDIINDDGEDDWVEVEATSIGEATTKAAAMPQTESVTGTPALQRGPTRAARPTVGAGDVGEEEGGGGRRFQFVQPGGGTGDTGFIRLPLPGDPQTAPMPVPGAGDFLGDTGFIQLPGIGAPGGTSFQDFTQTIDPDLIDPRSSSYVPPPVTTAPPVVTQPPTTPSMWSTDQWGNYVPPPPIATGPTIGPIGGGFGSTDQAGGFGAVPTAPPTVIDPGGLVSRGGTLLRGGGFGPTDQAGGMGGPPAFVPPAVLPPAVSGFADDVPFAADVGPVGGGAVNGAGNGAVNGGAGGNGEVVIDPATGIPILTSREMIDDQVLRRAGMRRALQNVFGQQLGSGVGPLAGYLQRQAWPLSDAMTAGAYADMARAFGRDRDLATLGGTAAGPQQFDYGLPSMGGAAATGVVPSDGATADFATQRMEAMLADPKDTAAAASDAALGGLPAGYSFEDFLRTTRDQPTGLGGAYGQALQDVGYLRGLGRDALPPVLQSAFDPGSEEATRDVAGLLGAAQRGRYSGLVSSRFRQPTQQDLFADYFLSRQDAAKAGQTPQNFLNFAASRFGL